MVKLKSENKDVKYESQNNLAILKHNPTILKDTISKEQAAFDEASARIIPPETNNVLKGMRARIASEDQTELPKILEIKE